MSGAAGKVVVITGASSGIGRGAARAFAARGDQVVLAARSAGSLEEVAAECRELRGGAVAVPTDVSDEGSVQELARRAVEEYGRIDAWVNAAAVWSYGHFEDTRPRFSARSWTPLSSDKSMALGRCCHSSGPRGTASWSTSAPSIVGCPRRTSRRP